jgi:hypothetical protein
VEKAGEGNNGVYARGCYSFETSGVVSGGEQGRSSLLSLPPLPSRHRSELVASYNRLSNTVSTSSATLSPPSGVVVDFSSSSVRAGSEVLRL